MADDAQKKLAKEKAISRAHAHARAQDLVMDDVALPYSMRKIEDISYEPAYEEQLDTGE